MTAARWKALPWVLGLVLLAFSFVAANRLLHTQEGNNGAAPDAPKKDAKAAPSAAPNAGGLTVLGTVDAPAGIARVDAPSLPALSGATVTEVLVREGQEVKVGDLLVRFEDSAFRPKLEQAEAALAGAHGDAVKAAAQKEALPKGIELQKLAIRKAESDLTYAQEAYTRARESFEVVLAADRDLTDDDRNRRRRNDPELLKGEHQLDAAKFAVEKEKHELPLLQAKPVEADVLIAAAKIKGATAAVAEAKALVESTKVKAAVAGVVERISAHPGMTFGPATREPALYIIPAGARIVHAEVDAEFAHKIADRVGKKVTICDSHNFTPTYEGKVVRTSTGYMPKRGSGDLFAVNPAQVLECEIEVLDPTPVGKPPLHVNQRVRVVFGP